MAVLVRLTKLFDLVAKSILILIFLIRIKIQHGYYT